VILRARYTEDALAAAAARGVRQYVIVGAGYDSFALRRPEFARDVAVFEVDHPATQRRKLARLRELGVEPSPATLHFVAADLAAEELDAALARSPFDPAAPAFFAWLGVSAYLDRDANLRTLRAIARAGAPGSELVFTYLDQRRLDAPGPAQRRLLERFAAIGEPWVSGFHPGELLGVLRAAGLELVEDTDYLQLDARYGAGLAPPDGGHVARAAPSAG
jgi:methyltransferase (TIGR00027 family)